MNRIDRLFGILIMLQSKKYITVEDIAAKFRISVRTVYRDIKSLCGQGVPVSFEPYKGYFIMQGYFLPPVAFSSEEANALLLMEAMVAGFADKSILKHYSSALSKVKCVLRSSQKEKLEILNSTIRFQFPSCINTDFEYLSVLQNAITARCILQLSYTNKNDETSNRQVEPIGLVFYAFSWHLVAWCHHRNDYRDFKVSRIVNLKCTRKPFEKTDHIALNDYMKALPVPY